MKLKRKCTGISTDGSRSGPIPLFSIGTEDIIYEWVITMQIERKIIRRIYGPLEEHGRWRRRTNKEIDELLEQGDIVRFIKSQRLRWLGHVERMSELRLAKRMYKARMTGRRKQGRPRNRWRDEIEQDLRRMDVRGWSGKAKDRESWKQVVQQAKTHAEL